MPELKVPTHRLQPGMFIRIPLGWRDHPFVLNSFRIKDDAEVLLLRQLPTEWVYFEPERSTAGPLAEAWRPWRAYAVMRLWHHLETPT